jgi:hypothetical protein
MKRRKSTGLYAEPYDQKERQTRKSPDLHGVFCGFCCGRFVVQDQGEQLRRRSIKNAYQFFLSIEREKRGQEKTVMVFAPLLRPTLRRLLCLPRSYGGSFKEEEI